MRRFTVRMNNGDFHFTDAVSFAQAINNIKYRIFGKYSKKDLIEGCIEYIEVYVSDWHFVLDMFKRKLKCINPEGDFNEVYLRLVEKTHIEDLISLCPKIDYDAL